MRMLGKISLNYLLLIVITSLFVRVIFLILYSNPFTFFAEDSLDYYLIAKHAEINGIMNWESHERDPLISFLIIPFIKIFNESLSIFFIRLFMIFLSTITCIVLYFLSLEITQNRKISLITSIVYCLYPYSIFLSNQLLTENLSSLLISLIALYFIKFINKDSLYHLVIASFLMGLLSLTRSSYIYLPVFLSFIILLTKKTNTKKFSYTVIIFLIFYLTLSPWIIKNYNQFNSFVPTTTRLGYGLLISNYDFQDPVQKKGGYSKSMEIQKILEDTDFMNPVDKSNYLKKIVFKKIINNKIIFLKLTAFRLLNFFNPKPNPYTNLKKKDFISIFFYTPILLFFLASFSKKKYSLNDFILLIIILYSVLISIIFYGFPRFRYTVDSLIFIMSINFIFEKIKDKKLFKFLIKSN